MTLFSITLILFLIMDPIGNIASCLTLFEKLPRARRRVILIREMILALIAMLAFAFLGNTILSFLEISDTTVRLAAGLILFLVALKTLFPATDSIRANITSKKEEPFLVPLAIPLIAGPSLLAAIMLFAHLPASQGLLLPAIFIAWTLSLLILFFAEKIQTALTKNGLIAAERLMAMVLIMLAIQRFLEGLEVFVKTCS